MKAQSLRTRLIVIILTPLLVVSVIAGSWQVRNATNRAEDIFDRGLLSAALAISRDVALSGGDALSPATRRLISDTSGGEVFYHVFAPDGVFVTGYATPPRPPTGLQANDANQLYYDGTYQRRIVRVLRFQDAATIDDVAGLFTITVWQDLQVRTSFIRDVSARAIAVIAMILCSVALIVWFGVGVGLRPLLDLQEAIAKRTPNDLEPIRRAVPLETQGIVSTLNSLLERITRRISSKDEFISNAAHQLRNPIAGVLALAESIGSAPTPEAAQKRSTELVSAARSAAHLTNQLLSFERAKGSDISTTGERLDFGEVLEGTVTRFRKENPNALVTVNVSLPGDKAFVLGDRLMLQEALLNLLTNALRHGGAKLTRIDLALRRDRDRLELRVQDDGIGIAEEDRLLVLGRFAQANDGPGSGLGLPIAVRVMEAHGGSLKIGDASIGLLLLIHLPLA